jgi:predicted RND superfamily exporter protein
MRSAAVRTSVRTRELDSLTREIDRLAMNLMEMQDMAFIGGQDKVDDKCKQIVGDPENPESPNLIDELLGSIEADRRKSIPGLSGFQRDFAPYFQESVLRMASTEPIEFDQLPLTVLDRYSNTDRNLFLVTVYPAGDVYSDTDVLDRFVDDLERISDRATGMPPLAVAMIRIFGRDGRNAMLLTLVIVFLLLMIDFKNYRHALMAMIPLAIGVFWLVGVMNLVGMQFTIMAFMGLPMIIGIGIDDGVHILHRWKNEGKGKLKTIFSSTGKAIFLTSLTTMLAFGSLSLSSFPAWAMFGMPLFIGVGTCFLTSVIILPGILGWVEKRNETKG